MAEETLITAARRMVRFVRIDNEAHGGLLSRDTTSANETLARELDREVLRLQQAAERAAAAGLADARAEDGA